jgi:two-component system, NtrC family, sensor kinase
MCRTNIHRTTQREKNTGQGGRMMGQSLREKMFNVRWMPSLRWAMIIYVVLPLLGMATLGSYLSLSSLGTQIEKRMEEEVALIARAIRLPVGYALEHGEEASLQSALKSVFLINRVYGAYVYDAAGNQILAFGLTDPTHSKGHIARVASSGLDQGEYGTMGGREVFSYFVPLPDSFNRINGLLQVTRRKSEFDDYINSLRFQLLGWLLLAGTVIAGLIVYGHEQAIGVPINRLVQSMIRVGHGEKTHRTHPEGPHEIRTLAAAFNTMLDDMAGAEAEIERRRVKEGNLQQRLRQNEKFAVIGHLAAGVAHELGGPLSVIGGKAQRALRSLEETPEGQPNAKNHSEKIKKGLEAIRAEVARMENIVWQLLDFSRWKEGQQREILANHLAQTAAAAVRNEADMAGVHVTVRESPIAPSLKGDRLRLQQALVNLIRNGIQAVPGGRVELGVTATEQEVGFIVDDNGPGVHADIRSRVFEPFVTTKRPGQGTGLGLALVNNIVHEHSGKVEVAQSPLGGAQFKIILPRQNETTITGKSET